MRSGIISLVVLSAWLVAVGCDASASRERLVIGVSTDADVLLPVVESSALDGEINEQLYLGLNSARWEDGELRYVVDDLALAERWEFGPDSTKLTYDLRADARWSDGEPLTADDVVFTYELIRRQEVASQYADFWSNLDSVVAGDDRTVTFHFSRPYPRMLFHSGLGIIPRHVYSDAAEDRESLIGHPAVTEPGGRLVVSGPYRVSEWRRGERLVLSANPRAFTGAPATENVIFRIIPEESTRLVELENGTLDVIDPAPLERAARLAEDPRFRVEAMEDRFYDYVAWNGAEFEAFRDPLIRRALSLAIDRDGILHGLGIGSYATAAAGPYPGIFRALRDPDVSPDPHAPDSARALLAASGWVDRDNDGLRERDGEPFRFTLLTQAGNDRREAAAQMIQAQYESVGVSMTVRALEFGTLLNLVFDQGDYQATLLGWQVGLEPDYLIGHFWPPDHPYNITGYANASLDSLIPLARSARTAAQAAPLWREAAVTIAQDRPYAFLWFFDGVVLVNERVHNTRIDTYGVYQNLHQWRLSSPTGTADRADSPR